MTVIAVKKGNVFYFKKSVVYLRKRRIAVDKRLVITDFLYGLLKVACDKMFKLLSELL